jgi:hypothetical protein
MRTKANGTHIRSEYATIQLETIQNAELNFLLHKKKKKDIMLRVCAEKQGQILNKDITK